jgi:tetratricopeptide (TPR) repeat protein
LLREHERTHIREAIRRFDEAIAKDQKFAGAYAGLADAYCSLVYGHQMMPAQGLALASEAVKRALAIDPAQVEALTALGLVRLLSFDWEAAEEAFRYSVVTGSGYAPAYFGLGVFLTLRGRFDEGLAALKKSQRLDPFSPLVFLHLALNCLWRQEYSAALREARRAAELAPGWPPAFSLIPLVLVHEHRNSEALASLDALGNPGERFPLAAAVRGYAYAMAGRARSAREVLVGLQETAEREHDPNITGRAAIHVALCEDDMAVSLLEQAWDRRDPGLLLLRFAPAWRPLHSNRRFQTLLERIG